MTIANLRREFASVVPTIAPIASETFPLYEQDRRRAGHSLPDESSVVGVRNALDSLCRGTCDLLVDPFCGSGTTGVVARQLGLPFVGVDLSPKRAEVAAWRALGVVDKSGAARVSRHGQVFRPVRALRSCGAYPSLGVVAHTEETHSIDELAGLNPPHPASQVLVANSRELSTWESLWLPDRPERVWVYTSPPFDAPDVVQGVVSVCSRVVDKFHRVRAVLEWWEPSFRWSKLRRILMTLADGGWVTHSLLVTEDHLKSDMPLILVGMEVGLVEISH